MILPMTPDVTGNYLVFRSSFFENRWIRFCLADHALRDTHLADRYFGISLLIAVYMRYSAPLPSTAFDSRFPRSTRLPDAVSPDSLSPRMLRPRVLDSSSLLLLVLLQRERVAHVDSGEDVLSRPPLFLHALHWSTDPRGLLDSGRRSRS
jgi:hypothetical protein